MNIQKLRSLMYVHSWSSIITIVCMIGTIFFSLISLITYKLTDNSFFYYSSDAGISNKAGALGAHSAAFLYFLFGTGAFSVIFFLVFIAYRFLIYGTLRHSYDQIAGWILFILSGCLLGAWYRVSVIKTGFVPGGAIGNVLVFRISTFDKLLSSLCIHGLLFISLLLITRASILRLPNVAIRFFKNRSIGAFIKRTFVSIFSLRVSYSRFKTFFLDALVPEDLLKEEYSSPSAIFKDAQHEQKKSVEKNEHTADLKVKVSESHVATIEPKLYQLPAGSLFSHPENSKEEVHQARRHEQLAAVLEEKLQRFGIQGKVVGIKSGPVVTLFEYQPHIDAKVSKILALEDDLALALQALSIRIIAPIPGRSLVGFEVSNQIRVPVYFSQMLQSTEWQKSNAQLPLILGADTSGAKVVVDLATMPHLLIAGATGSGKSVALNAMIISLLCKRSPDELRLILIDPKRLEFATYAAIPHLLFPIVDDPKQAGNALRWAVQEMERRYRVLAEAHVRHIYDYQRLCASQPDREKLPLIVIIIDELSDLMMVAAKDVELRIARIAQMARAAGIHLIVATQRPSVDVITGIIKVNFPSRIAFKVSSKIDSRIILDCAGADKLLGKGDMLYVDTASNIMRVHGAFISDEEREAVAHHVRSQQEVEYCDINEYIDAAGGQDVDEDDQALYQEVLEFLKSIDEVSISLLQRKFRIGYNRSARIIDTLQAQGLIIATEGGKTRKVIH